MVGHYLMFNRNCAEALEVYKDALGLEVIEMQRYRDVPKGPGALEVPEADRDLVLHARCSLGEMEIMCADASGLTEAGSNMYVTITTADEPFVRGAYNALAKDGTIYMELAPSFFAKAHGSLQDRFGINWMFTALA